MRNDNIPNPSKWKTTLHALGSNGNHQLGIGHAEDVNIPQRCKFLLPAVTRDPPTTVTNTLSEPEDLDYIPLDSDEKIQKLVAGGNHTLLLTSKGRVWAAGSNEVGQCGGVVSSKHCSGAWELLEFTDANTTTNDDGEGEKHAIHVTDIAAAWTVSYFVVDGHEVYVSGADDKGALGLGIGRTSCEQPTRCFDLHRVDGIETRIARVAACMNHVVVLSSSGKLYGWGASRKGQLGEVLKIEKAVWQPVELKLEGLDEWAPRQVVTGRDFTFVVGDRIAQRCFLGDAKRSSFDLPALNIMGKDEQFDIFSSWTRLAAKSMDGNLYDCGRAGPNRVPKDHLHEGVAIYAVGSEHSIAVLQDGSVVAWGWGEHGNCGAETDVKNNVVGTNNTIFVPDGLTQVVGVAAGCATSFFWVEEG